MSSAKKDSDFIRDIVYMPASDQTTVEHVKVLFKIEPLRLIITVRSDRDIEKTDLEAVSKAITDTVLLKMKIDIYHDCDVYLEAGGVKKRLRYNPAGDKIESIEEVKQ
jgi:hypothetical protein